jgi:elongation factor Ts
VAEITAALVKELREKSGAGMMDCKKALAATGGDLDKAMDELRKQGLATAQKKSARVTKDGAVDSYIHAGGKIGVLVEVGVETDFVSRSEPFREFTHDLAMQVAAASPIWVSRDEVPQEVIERERAIYAESDQIKGKPENVVEKIITGKLEKFFGETCLMEQAFVKDPDRTIEQVRTVCQLIFHMVSRTYCVYAVGWIQGDDTVQGGTGWGVELAKWFNRPVSVFDQARHDWFTWKDGHWAPDAPVIPDRPFAATGTRNLTDEGRRAIGELFERSFGPAK